MSKKKEDAAKLDVLACAERCDARATECNDALPTIAAELRDAAKMLRAMHAALLEVDCTHTITFTVTQAMIDTGRETRPLGKYCMICGALMAKAEKPPKTDSENKPQEGAS